MPPRLLLAATLAAAGAPAAPADDFDDWTRATAALKPNDQVVAVRAKFGELNPMFQRNGQELTCQVRDGAVREVRCDATYVTDLRALRGFPALGVVSCRGENNVPNRFADLSPLQGMRLTWLDVGYTEVASLSPLRGMPLTGVDLSVTKVKDLTPLHDAPLQAVTLPPHLDPRQAEFLKAKELTHFAADSVGLDSPTLARILVKSRLETFRLTWDDHLTTLDFLRKMPLRQVDVRYSGNVVSLDPLTGCATLESLSLQAGRSPRLSLAPLKGKTLSELFVVECPAVRDLTPLAGMTTLKSLAVSATSVTDLSPVAGLTGLEGLFIGRLRVKSLKPIAGLTKVSRLDVTRTAVGDRDFSPILKLPLEHVTVDADPKTNRPSPAVAKLLKSIDTLKTVNSRPAGEVLR